MAGEIPTPHSELPNQLHDNRLGKVMESVEGNEYSGKFTGQGFIYKMQHEPLGPTLTFFSSMSKLDYEQTELEHRQSAERGDLSVELPLRQEIDLGDMLPGDWTGAEVEYDITIKARKIRDIVVETETDNSIEENDNAITLEQNKPKTVFQKVRDKFDRFRQKSAFDAYARQRPASYSGLVRMIRAYESKGQGTPISLLEAQTGLFPSEIQKRLTDLQESGLIMVEGEAVRLTLKDTKVK